MKHRECAITWFKPFATGNTPVGDCIFEPFVNITVHVVQSSCSTNNSSIFCSNSEASASELLRNLEEMSPC